MVKVENEIRNKNGSYKDEAKEVTKKAEIFIKELIEDHCENMSVDMIKVILYDVAMTECTMAVVMNMEM